jgi:hypothetical protein
MLRRDAEKTRSTRSNTIEAHPCDAGRRLRFPHPCQVAIGLASATIPLKYSLAYRPAYSHNMPGKIVLCSGSGDR